MRHVRAALLFVMSLALGEPSSAAAWCQSCSTPQGGSMCRQSCPPCDAEGEVPLAWRRPCFEYAVELRGSRDLGLAQVEFAIARGLAQWTTAVCANGLPVGFQVRRSARPSECNIPEFSASGGNANTIAFVGDWGARQHASGAFALTTTWFSRRTGEIFDADMEINQENFEYALCPEEGCSDGTVDLENTLTHEIGHMFGMAHSDANDQTTMWACADNGEVHKRDLSQDDIDGLCAIYPPGSLLPLCEFTPQGGFAAECRGVRERALVGESVISGLCGAAPGRGAGACWGLLGLLMLLRLRRRRAPSRR